MVTREQRRRLSIRRSARKEQSKATELQRHRRKLSFRLGSQALRQALSEATPSQRRQLRKGGFTTRPILVEDPKGTAFADPGRVRAGFATTRGKLNVPHVLGVARHEVSHLLGAGHLAMRATPKAPVHAGLPGTPRSVKTMTRTAKMPIGRQQHRATVLEVRRGRRPSARAPQRGGARTPISRVAPGLEGKLAVGRRMAGQGFQTSQLLKTAVGGTESQQRRARMQMIRLGRRLRGKVDF